MKQTTTHNNFTAHLYCHDELVAVQSGNRFPQLMTTLLSWIQELPDDARGIIVDNRRGIIVQRCEYCH